MANATDALFPNDLGVSSPITVLQVVNLVIVFAAGAFAAASGVGGGAIYVPLYIVLFQLVYEAVPLSKAAVCGAAIAFFVSHLTTPVPTRVTKHPDRFAYDAIMVMEPATLLGTVFGVLGSRTAPMWLITAMMALLLGLSATKTFAKAHRLFEKESRERGGGAVAPSATHNEANAPLVPGKSVAGYGGLGSEEAVGMPPLREPATSEPWLGWRCLLSVGVCFLSVLAAATLSDDRIMQGYQAVECGSFGFWMLTALNSLICGGFTLWNVSYLVNSYDLVRRQCSVAWSARTGVKYALLCLFAGFMSSLCGIGGSTIKGPILLEMGLHPTLAKATSQVMLLSTVTSSALQFYFSNELPPVYGATFFLLGTLSGFVGKFAVDRFVERNGRQSTIVYLLAWYIVIATLSMGSIGCIIVLSQVEPNVNWYQLGFRNVCDPIPDDLGALKWLVSSDY